MFEGPGFLPKNAVSDALEGCLDAASASTSRVTDCSKSGAEESPILDLRGEELGLIAYIRQERVKE